jgi:beta propeller repeat protein
MPSLSGDRVAFARKLELFVADVKDGSEVAVPMPALVESVDSPMLSGDWLVYSVGVKQSEVWGDDSGVFAYNLSTRETRVLAKDGPYVQRWPSIDGTQVVFADDRYGHHTPNPSFHLTDLFVAELGSPPAPARRLTSRTNVEQEVGIQGMQGGRVVTFHSSFEADTLAESCQLVMYDVASGKRRDLAPKGPCTGRREERAFALEQQRLVFEEEPNGASDLVYLDLTTEKRVKLTTHKRRSTGARMSGGLLVWQDDRNDHWDVYAMDLKNAEKGEIYPEGANQ